MRMQRQNYDGIVLCIPQTVAYSRYSTRGAHWFLGSLIRQMTQSAGINKDQIDGLCVSSFSLFPDTAIGVIEHLGISASWLDHIPFGGASGIIALHRAARAVQAGDANIVACIAGDTNQPDSFRRNTASFSQFAQDAVYPYGSGGPNASFAFLTDHYMRTYGARPEDFGSICVAQRDNALTIPHALFKTPLTMDEYLSSTMIADPIRLFDCVMPCAGAEGFLVTREDIAREHNWPHAHLRGVIERHNAFPDDPIQFRGGWVLDHENLFHQADISQKDIDFFETYDDYPVITMLQLEDLGFCEKGEAKDFIRQHDLRAKGTFPINTSGGQLSVGQAGAAGGLLGIVEAIRQLTGQVLGTAVDNARIGLVSGFGMINFDRGLCTGAAILSAD